MTTGIFMRSRAAVATCWLVLLALVLAGGCADKPHPTTQPEQAGQSGLPTTSMRIGLQTFDLEIARTPDELQTGLMNRNSMPADHGMIFVFSAPQELHFWMKNTRIPLDIIFLDSGGGVVSIHHMKALDTTTDTASGGLSQYAIELNLDATDAAGVEPGDQLVLPPAIRPKPATQPGH
jgi:uncharacterized protein